MSDMQKAVLGFVILGILAAVALFFAFGHPASTVPDYYISGNVSQLPANRIVVTIDRIVQNFTVR
jgi:hypothetical protein